MNELFGDFYVDDVTFQWKDFQGSFFQINRFLVENPKNNLKTDS